MVITKAICPIPSCIHTIKDQHTLHCNLLESMMPKVAFAGAPVHYHTDVKLTFGDLVRAFTV
jgi:hypothetical protein